VDNVEFLNGIGTQEVTIKRNIVDYIKFSCILGLVESFI